MGCENSGFDELGYLSKYPDVAAAVTRGDFPSGEEHYQKFGKGEGRAPPGEAPKREQFGCQKFEYRAPSAQTAVDVFQGHWACDLGPLLGVVDTGSSNLFTGDRRPQMMADALGTAGRFDGMDILEIGPLEGAHSYAMERLGANSILAVESNREAWLKCLVVKELLDLRKTRFVLGDVNEFFRSTAQHFDAVLCSGVLYHMADPVNFIRLMAGASNGCFVWTHYFDEHINSAGFTGTEVRNDALTVTYWSHDYGELTGQFWGGVAPNSCWLSRDHLLATFAHFGLSEIEVLADEPKHPHGPAILFAARRPGRELGS